MRISLKDIQSAPPGTFDYHYFWGKNTCLSNWHPTPFCLNGQQYSTMEHYIMAQKAVLFGDQESLVAILNAPTPKEAKRLGREVKNFVETTWAACRYQIALDGCTAKFLQNMAARFQLMSTGNRILVEASPYDRIWGIGLTATDPRAKNPNEWPGMNLLGFVLMEVRSNLLATSPKIQAIRDFEAEVRDKPVGTLCNISFVVQSRQNLHEVIAQLQESGLDRTPDEDWLHAAILFEEGVRHTPPKELCNAFYVSRVKYMLRVGIDKIVN